MAVSVPGQCQETPRQLYLPCFIPDNLRKSKKKARKNYIKFGEARKNRHFDLAAAPPQGGAVGCLYYPLDNG
jgi:hypothetical protein